MAGKNREAVVHDTSSHSSDVAVDPEKATNDTQIEQIHTNERVPGHQYYEKNGLRTYGDGEDHDHEPPVCILLQTGLELILTWYR